MKNVSGKSRRSPRTVIICSVCILLLLIVITSFFNVARYAVSRFADGFFYPYMRLSSPPEKLTDTSLLMEEKSTLAAKVEHYSNVNRDLALQGQAAVELMEENRQLRNVLKLQSAGQVKFTVAEIMLRDPLNFRSGFTVSKGSRDGVKNGSAVVEVSENGKLLLVGVISEVGARTSKVITIANPALRISGRVSSNKEIGFTNAAGQASRRDRITFGMLPVRDDYIQGNLVTTTGFEQGIPAGIKIGELHTINNLRPYNQQEYQCELTPAAHFASLRFVAIIRHIPPMTAEDAAL